MFSIVVSSKDKEKLNNIFLPSLNKIKNYLCDNHLSEIDLIIVEGTESLTKNYNVGMKQCKYKTKFFIHEDVDLLDNDYLSLFFKIDFLFKYLPDTGLVGLVGTTEIPKGFWWNCTRPSIKGKVQVPHETEIYWLWDCNKDFYDVQLIDGFFMATNTDIPFSEDIVGFHLYDLDYCHVMRENNYKVRVIPHMVCHTASYKDTSWVNFDHYHKKWNLL